MISILIFHNLLHIIIPLMIALYFYKSTRGKSFMLMLSAYIIDFDHLLADPVFDSGRCSIGYHPLHSYLAIGAYIMLLYFPKTRLIGIGLLTHILVDISDCFRISFN